MIFTVYHAAFYLMAGMLLLQLQCSVPRNYFAANFSPIVFRTRPLDLRFHRGEQCQ